MRRIKLFVILGVLLFTLLGSFYIGCGDNEDGGCGSEDGKKGLCHDCTIPDQCESDACTCVYNQETKERYCWACVPPEYDPLKGSKQKETYICESVKK